MINGKQAAAAVKTKYPERTVTGVYDYDNEHYIVEAVENVKEVDYDAPYYGVAKSDGKVTCFSPGEDFEKFFKALDNPVDF